LTNLTFILTNVAIHNFSSIKITDNVELRKATEKEIDIAREHLLYIDIYTHFYSEKKENQNRELIYEIEVKEEPLKNGVSYNKHKLPKEDWRYWVISYSSQEAYNNNYEKIGYAMSLLKYNFQFGITYTFWDTVGKPDLHHPADFIDTYSKIEQKYYENMLEIDFNEIKAIPKIYSSLSANIDSYLFIKHAIKNFIELKKINSNTDLMIVGLFSIIESLVTHPPRLNENLDSISHQITNKLNLLIKMFERSVLYNTYFEEAKHETVWKKLYSYRSDIAHGSIADFQGKYLVLKSSESIHLFLEEITKNLILLALDKPDFLNDLKQC
jgi:hypothetical protein